MQTSVCLSVFLWWTGARQHTQASGGLGGEFGLHHRDSTVDPTHADAGDHSCKDHHRAVYSCALENSPDNHDDDSDEDRLSAAEVLAYDGSHQGANEASYLVAVDRQVVMCEVCIATHIATMVPIMEELGELNVYLNEGVFTTLETGQHTLQFLPLLATGHKELIACAQENRTDDVPAHQAIVKADQQKAQACQRGDGHEERTALEESHRERGPWSGGGQQRNEQCTSSVVQT